MPPISSTPLVRVAIQREVATLTLDSPANRNALSSALLTDFHAALDEAEAGATRVIVIDHVPPAFCAGADLSERLAASGPVPGSDAMARAMQRLRESSRPTIAAVHGAVRAGGIGLMASCDLVVVHPTVDFAFTEVRIGVAPAIISAPLLRRVSWSALAAPFLTGERFDAHEARRIGLVTHVDEDVLGVVKRLCDGIRRGGPSAVAATKLLLHRSPSTPFAEELDAMITLSDELFSSEEGREGLRSFAEKRLPRWNLEE